MSQSADRFGTALRAAGFKGEIEMDKALLAAMSTDNSVYQIMPDPTELTSKMRQTISAASAFPS